MNAINVIFAIGISAAVLIGATPAMAKDACGTELCMFGMLVGSKPAECSGPIKDFFSIVKYKNGHPSPSRTFTARQSFLNSCRSGNGEKKDDILAKYGEVIL